MQRSQRLLTPMHQESLTFVRLPLLCTTLSVNSKYIYIAVVSTEAVQGAKLLKPVIMVIGESRGEPVACATDAQG